MSKLIDEFMNDHKIITEMLENVKTLGINSKEGQKILMDAKKGLLDHLKKEDDFLYPTLREAAKSNSALQITLDLFATNMDTVSQIALDFFDKYSIGDSGLDFAKDLGHLIGSLKTRMRKEETGIYLKFDKLESIG